MYMGLLGHTLVYTYYMHFSIRTLVPVIAAPRPGRTLVSRLFATPLRPFGILMSITPHNRCTWLHGARETPTGSTWLHGAISSGFFNALTIRTQAQRRTANGRSPYRTSADTRRLLLSSSKCQCNRRASMFESTCRYRRGSFSSSESDLLQWLGICRPSPHLCSQLMASVLGRRRLPFATTPFDCLR